MIRANDAFVGGNGRNRADGLGAVRPPLRRRALHGLQGALHHTGLARAYVRARGLRGAVILMYHSVAGPDAARWIDPQNHISPRDFERHVAFLAQHRRVVSLSSLAEAIEQGDDPPAGTVVLTFDDGYRDNLTVAGPLLKAAGLPATLFLATGYVERGENQWIDQLYSAFVSRTRAELQVPDGQRVALQTPVMIRGAYARCARALRTGGFALLKSSGTRDAYARCARALRTAHPARRRELLDEIRAQLRPEGTAPRLTLTWEEVRQAAETFELGLHTREHVDMTALDDGEVEAELRRCRADAAAALGDAPGLFSFPYSRSDAAVRERVARAGFRAAAAREAAEVVRCGCDLYDLPRVIAPPSVARLAFITSGAYPALSQALVGRA